MTTLLTLIAFFNEHGAAIMGAIGVLGHLFPQKTAAYKAGDLAEKAKSNFNQ